MKNLCQLIVTLSFTLCAAFAAAEGKKVVPVVEKLYGNKKTVASSEVESWSMSDKDRPKKFVELNNKKFAIIHPSCFELEALYDEDDDGVTKAPVVAFLNTAKCTDSYGIAKNQTISVGLETGGVTSLESLGYVGHLLQKKRLIINGVSAVALTSVRDDCSSGECEPQLRQEIYLFCDKTPFVIRFDESSGKHSKDLIAKDNYAFPSVYKTMASSFKCK